MTILSPPVTSRSSWVEERQEGGGMFILEYFLANSLVSFSPGLIFSSCVYEQLSLCGWLMTAVLILNLSRHPGLSARLFYSPLIGPSIQSDFHPYGTYSLCKCLVYIPFIYGMLVCVSYSLNHWSAASVSQHVLQSHFLGLWSLLSSVPGSASSSSGRKLAKPREKS